MTTQNRMTFAERQEIERNKQREFNKQMFEDIIELGKELADSESECERILYSRDVMKKLRNEGFNNQAIDLITAIADNEKNAVDQFIDYMNADNDEKEGE